MRRTKHCVKAIKGICLAVGCYYQFVNYIFRVESCMSLAIADVIFNWCMSCCFPMQKNGVWEKLARNLEFKEREIKQQKLVRNLKEQ